MPLFSCFTLLNGMLHKACLGETCLDDACMNVV